MIVACEIATRVNTGTSFADQIGRIFRECSFVGIAAIGACMVIISGGVDLSSGAVMKLSAVILGALYVNAGAPASVSLAVALLGGGLVGCANGLLVGKVGLPPFIATLGFLSIARGLSYRFAPLSIPLRWEEKGERFFGFPLLGDTSFGLMIVLGALASVLMARFRWGRYVYAVGGNEEAARFAGVRVDWVKVSVYTMAGLFAGLAGCAHALYNGSANLMVGEGYELQIIAACAVGGVSFSGGQGSVSGALIGAVTLQVLHQLLLLLRVSHQYIEIAYGAAIILAVAIDQLRQRPVLGNWFGRKAA
jgi:ribose/xylose/arabinose/galactoside ABC-type transport system permease subunit